MSKLENSKFILKTDGNNYWGNIYGNAQEVEDALLEYMIDNEVSRAVVMRAAQRFLQYEMQNNLNDPSINSLVIEE